MQITNSYVTLRTVAERISRGVVLERRMPARFGSDPVLVSPGALLKLWQPNLEAADPALFAWAEEFVHPGHVVWDIGAHVGLFAFAAASRAGHAGRVIAIEADIWLAGLLRRSAQRASADRASINVLPLAVTDRNDLVHFHIAQRSRAANYLEAAGGSTQTGGIRETTIVMGVTLDWLLERLPAPQILKIDVEGAEALVLQGATRLLSDIRPTILCEVRPERAATVTTILQSSGYQLFDLASQQRQPIERAVFNTLAVAAS